MPKGTDSSWVEKLYSKCTRWKHFSRPRFGTMAFLIHHFADNVTYQSEGFLEKNRDTVLEDQINVIKNGQVSYLLPCFVACERDQDFRRQTLGKKCILF
jgi:myosin-5